MLNPQDIHDVLDGMAIDGPPSDVGAVDPSTMSDAPVDAGPMDGQANVDPQAGASMPGDPSGGAPAPTPFDGGGHHGFLHGIGGGNTGKQLGYAALIAALAGNAEHGARAIVEGLGGYQKGYALAEKQKEDEDAKREANRLKRQAQDLNLDRYKQAVKNHEDLIGHQKQVADAAAVRAQTTHDIHGFDGVMKQYEFSLKHWGSKNPQTIGLRKAASQMYETAYGKKPLDGVFDVPDTEALPAPPGQPAPLPDPSNPPVDTGTTTVTPPVDPAMYGPTMADMAGPALPGAGPTPLANPPSDPMAFVDPNGADPGSDVYNRDHNAWLKDKGVPGIIARGQKSAADATVAGATVGSRITHANNQPALDALNITGKKQTQHYKPIDETRRDVQLTDTETRAKETARHNRATEAQGGTRIQQGNQRIDQGWDRINATSAKQTGLAATVSDIVTKFPDLHVPSDNIGSTNPIHGPGGGAHARFLAADFIGPSAAKAAVYAMTLPGVDRAHSGFRATVDKYSSEPHFHLQMIPGFIAPTGKTGAGAASRGTKDERAAHDARASNVDPALYRNLMDIGFAPGPQLMDSLKFYSSKDVPLVAIHEKTGKYYLTGRDSGWYKQFIDDQRRYRQNYMGGGGAPVKTAAQPKGAGGQQRVNTRTGPAKKQPKGGGKDMATFLKMLESEK